MSVPPVVPWVAGFAGVGLLYAAVRGLNPVEQFRAVLTGGPDARMPRSEAEYVDSVAVPFSPTFGEPSTSVGLWTPTPELTEIRPGLKLTPRAAAGFKAWESAFGEQIPTTSGWRDYAVQLAEWKKDPVRFAHPGKSRHVLGDAVDVDQNWINGLGAARASQLRITAAASGWRQARYDKGEAGCGNPAKLTNDEPWHFSYKVCG